ncbi:MAG: hypothetical protein DMF41_12115, partial [Verrucomicrobia bacterium]
QVAKPSGQLSGPPKIDNDDDIVAASSETKLSKMIAVEARNACAIMDRPAARPEGSRLYQPAGSPSPFSR